MIKKIFLVSLCSIAILINSCGEKDLSTAAPVANITDLSGVWIQTFYGTIEEPTVNQIYHFWSIIPVIRFTPCINNCGMGDGFGRIDFNVNLGTSMKDSFGAFIDTVITNPISWADTVSRDNYFCTSENGKITTIIETKNTNVYQHTVLKFDGRNLWIDWENGGVAHFIKRIE